jgi:hypothetical protein
MILRHKSHMPQLSFDVTDTQVFSPCCFLIRFPVAGFASFQLGPKI